MNKKKAGTVEQADAPMSPLSDPKTGTPLSQRSQPGYYAGWDVMTQWAFWDQATRDVVEQRLAEPKPIRFFNPEETIVMSAVLDRILPQDDRIAAKRIPLLPTLDERLHTNRIEGYRYEDMPSDQQAYRWAAESFNAMATEAYSASFAELSIASQESLLHSLHEGEPVAAKSLWARMNVKRFWTMLVTDASAAYYAHPWAWDEVGFGGPAYPRGYMRLEDGQAEPWEVQEQRYEWSSPAGCLSDAHHAKGEKDGTH